MTAERLDVSSPRRELKPVNNLLKRHLGTLEFKEKGDACANLKHELVSQVWISRQRPILSNDNHDGRPKTFSTYTRGESFGKVVMAVIAKWVREPVVSKGDLTELAAWAGRTEVRTTHEPFFLLHRRCRQCAVH